MLIQFSFVLCVLLCQVFVVSSAETLHGGTYLAIAGKDSVLLASDSRFIHPAMQQLLLGSHPRSFYRVGFKTVFGCDGIELHGSKLKILLSQKLADHTNSELSTEHIAKLVSGIMYDQGFHLSPIIAGFDCNDSPYLCSMDSLGAVTVTDSYVVSGTASNQLHALCESLYVPGLSATQLVKLAERCLKLAFQRDILSGSNLRLVTLHKGDFYVKDVDFQDV
eukprot:gene31065-37545_t